MGHRLLLIFTLALFVALNGPALAAEHLRLATTSSENSGLLAKLLPFSEQANNCRVDQGLPQHGQQLFFTYLMQGE